MHLNWEMVDFGNGYDDHMIFIEKTYNVCYECVLYEYGIDIVYCTPDGMKSWDTERELITAIKTGLVARRAD